MGAVGLAVAVLAGVAPPARGETREAGRPPSPGSPSTDARPKHVGRALLLTGGLIGGALIWYWRDLDFNTRDWDLKWDGESWKRKLLTFDAVRFDQNLFQTNAVNHARAGLAHYQIFRGSGFGVPASVAGTLATSVIWEYMVEFKELISLNDMVVNTVAGLALGESFYQLGEFLLRSSPNVFTRGLAAVLSPVASFNDLVDGRRRGGEGSGRLGLTRDLWHRFHLTGGLSARSFDGGSERNEIGIGVGAELVTLPGYRRPEALSTWISPGSFNAVEADLDISRVGHPGGAVRARTTVAGAYRQRYGRAGAGRISGWGRLLAVGTAFEFEEVERPGGPDYLAVMKVLGPLCELDASAAGLRVRWLGEVFGDFAMVKALAMEGRMPVLQGEVYHPSESGGTIPSVLGARGYYYALGLSAASRLALEYRGWHAGVEWHGDRFRSIAGFDRFREEMTRELHLADRRSALRTSLGLQPGGGWPRLQAAMDWRWREGRAGALAVEHVDRRLTGGVSLIF